MKYGIFGKDGLIGKSNVVLKTYESVTYEYDAEWLPESLSWKPLNEEGEYTPCDFKEVPVEMQESMIKYNTEGKSLPRCWKKRC